MTSSVDGLISGLSTSDLISQLMKVEAAPQTRLQNKVKAQKTALAAYQSVNTKLAALQTAAEAVTNADTWKAVKATSSSSAITASAAAGASTGNLTFDVTQLARAQVSTATVAASGDITTADTISITIGTDAPVAIDVSADKSAQGVVDAINGAGLSVKAALVTTSGGSTVLQLTGVNTGTAGAFTVSNFDPTVTDVITAQDAIIQVGDLALGGYTVSSSTNVFTNLMSGVTLTATKVESGITVGVTSDPSAIADKIQAMVTAANAALTEISNQTKYDSTTKTSATLTGDFTVRQLSQDIPSTVSVGLAGFGSYAQLGVQLDKSGQLTFDEDAFLAAYAADPASVETGATGLAGALTGVADTAQTVITANTQSRNTLINSLNDQIASWDLRLAARQEALQRQFANLEIALGKIRDQSSWLAGQIASLPTGGA